MLPQPIQSCIKPSQRVLIAGAGGGFDFLCGVPLMLALEAQGCETHLANLTFTSFKNASEVRRHTHSLVEITSASSGDSYFPEKWLAQWFKERFRRELSIWCFEATGLVPYQQSYAYLVNHLQIDTILVVDGGVDSLLRGDEHSLGTPLWDALTVGAVHQLEGPQKLLASVAFGAERWDKISHAQALARIADLTRAAALLGVTSLLRAMDEGKYFMEAAQFIFDHQPGVRQSTVVSALLAALNGEFGERPVNAYTQATPLWVSPLMCLYWFFDLDEVARQKLFLPCLAGTQTLAEAAAQLRAWTEQQAPCAWESIPI